jgi:L-threonylcarbamoyladenylate synthase
MNTQILNIDKKTDLDTALSIIAAGNPIAFPTETVFGIGADIESDVACSAIYKIKSRDGKKPLSAHVSSIDMALPYIVVENDYFHILAETFLPGPLAIICKKSDRVKDFVCSGFPTLSIRYPSDNSCQKLISAFGRPLAATSANYSGEKSLTNSAECFNIFNGVLEAIVQGGSEIGLESTIIAIDDAPKILRQGATPKEAIEEAIKIKL